MMRFASALFLIASCVLAAGCSSSPAIDELHGARLGMTPAEVRSRFAPEGQFSVTPGGEGEILLDWRARDAQAVTEARFEFHEGLLVAIRAKHGANTIAVQRLEVTDWAVRLARVGDDNRAETLLLARGCPAHESEVQELLALR